jgi:predicted DNA-binding transcriptional regulator AlpA
MSLEHSPQRDRTGIGLKPFNRFADLKAAGLFNSRMTLDRAIARGDFPPGRLMGNSRLWTEPEILESLDRCPTEKQVGPKLRKSAEAAA